MVVLNTFSIIIAVRVLTCNTVYQFVCNQIMVRFTYHFKTVGPQYGTCFMSSFRHQEFGGGFYICGKLVDPIPRYILAKFHFHDL